MQKRTAEKPLKNVLEGTLSITSRGTGYVRIPSRGKENDIEIEPRFLNTGLHGDIVAVLPHSKKSGKNQTGEITAIILRAKRGFAGTLSRDGDAYIVSADDQKFYTSILIPKAHLAGGRAGEKVYAEITLWQDPKKLPVGRIEKVLGKPGEHEAEIQAIALEKGFATGFPKDVEEEARHLKMEIPNLKSRRDFRTTPTFTIDPVDAKDFDDAISLQKNPDGTYEIGVHIADVSYYVRPKSAIDKEAFKRATSVYLVDRTIPMLPEVLSNDLASLKPDVERLTMSAVFTMNHEGKILGEWYGRTVIRSQKRFTYEEAQSVLDKKHGIFYEELHILNRLAKKFEKERLAAGALVLETEEVKFELDARGVPISVYKKTRGDTHKLIEEFMLLANRKIAEYITKKSKKNIFIYRIHDLPDKEKMDDLKFFLTKLGHPIPKSGNTTTAKDLSAFLKKLGNIPEKNMIEMTIVRSMAKAIYSTKNIGHYGLAFEHYTHFTSPIRRYPDLAVHRLLMDYLANTPPKPERIREFENIAIVSSLQEKRAADAERASIKYKQVEYMSKRIGKIFTGMIAGVTDWGIYVEETETKSEGMVRIRDLGSDYYTYDKRSMALIGQKSKKRFRLGDKVRIRVAGADLATKTISYALA